MRERPIPFSAPMMRAAIAGTKTQTRRAWRDQPPPGVQVGYVPGRSLTPYGQPGDRLWAREAWYVGKCADSFKPSELDPATWLRDNGGLWYPATDTVPAHPISPRGRYRHGRFMPRWASRCVLEITEIRVERLQAISEADCIAEGATGGHGAIQGYAYAATPLEHYRHIWETINGPGSWDANPWVYAVTFRKVTP
jgi:hypothetical protein